MPFQSNFRAIRAAPSANRPAWRPSISYPRTSRLSKKTRDVCPGPLARLRGCYNLAACDGWGKTMAPAKFYVLLAGCIVFNAQIASAEDLWFGLAAAPDGACGWSRTQTAAEATGLKRRRPYSTVKQDHLWLEGRWPAIADGRVHRAMFESGARVPPHCLEAAHSRLRAAQVIQV